MEYTNKKDGLAWLWTAEKANEHALYDMWHDSTSGKDIECTAIPDTETAKAYIEARHIRQCYYGGTPYLLDRKYTSEEVAEYYRKEKKFSEMYFDMRNQVFTGDNGKKGLRDVCGKVLIEPLFDDIPELYTCFKNCILIPVVLNNRYFLYDSKRNKILTKGYDRIFRYFGAYIDYFVAVENGKKGILDGHIGIESTPIELDEVYRMPDPDGAIPYTKDGKIGFVWGNINTRAIFDEVVIESEGLTRVLLNGEWGWINSDGEFTLKESDASFGSWYDWEK